jgi:methionyl-tRNA synthetase
MEKAKITFKEFVDMADKLVIQLGRVVQVEKIEGSDKLLKLAISFDDDNPEVVQTCVTNLGGVFDGEEFGGEVFPFVMNLEPVKMMGVTSEVMIMPSQFGDSVELGLEKFSVGGRLM